MPTPDYNVICTKNVLIAKDIYDFRFTKPEGFSFIPGQFILFDVPHPDDENDIQTRAMSVASAPEEDELIFVAKLKEGGRASRWIEEKLKEGDSVRIQGAFGVFKLEEDSDQDCLLICTSTGVAPYRSQLIHFLERGDRRRFDLVFGVRTEEDLFWKEEFEELAKKHENFFVHFALSRPSEEWKGHKGRVQTLVPLIAQDFSGRKIYVCGNPDMTGEVKKLALEEWGVAKENLHMEGYI